MEKTLIELPPSTIVQETRAFQAAMQERFIEAEQRISGRRVLAFISGASPRT